MLYMTILVDKPKIKKPYDHKIIILDETKARVRIESGLNVIHKITVLVVAKYFKACPKIWATVNNLQAELTR